jgi:FixJ family two-component response regulator
MLDAVAGPLIAIARVAPPQSGHRPADRIAILSPCEQQVMVLVAAGKMNKQVAGDLGISAWRNFKLKPP